MFINLAVLKCIQDIRTPKIFTPVYAPLQELEPKLMDLRSAGSAGITASTKTLNITVHRSKEGNWQAVQPAVAEGGLGNMDLWNTSNNMINQKYSIPL